MKLDTAGLVDRDRAILDLERTWWVDFPTKEQAIRRSLGLSPSSYYQRLHRLIESPQALAYDPMVVRRARRARAARRRARIEGKTVSSPPRS